MTDTLLKKTVFLSFLAHLAAFSLFSFTFGARINAPQRQYIDFLGPFLRSADLVNNPWPAIKNTGLESVIKNGASIISLAKTENKEALVLYSYLKPAINFSFSREKSIFFPQKEPTAIRQNMQEPIIMFYPPIPNHFLLYFRDRQKVHIELMFNIFLSPQAKSILVKRKISSGNLEADLLSMRYIHHYLFIQQARFPADTWQTVKIDLTAGDENK